MKKIVLLIIVLLSFLLITGCEETKNVDALRFKEEYESINGQKNDYGKEIRTISIPKENPFIYQTAEEIVERINNNESFIVYFGFAKCPWCRSMIEQFIKSAKDHNIEKVYYVDVLDIRDVYKYENGFLEKTSEGTDGYNKLIELMKDVLSDYTLKDENNLTVEVGEKRIYAPNVVAVVNGKPTKMVEGISPSLTDPYMELTDEMLKESYDSFDCLWKCLEEEATTCQKYTC